MEVEFFSKFHCEFYWIERYWCHTKRNVRKNCDYSFKTLVAAVPKYLDEVDVLTMRRASLSGTSMHTGQENEGESNTELTRAVVEWNVKQYASHRRIDKLLKYEENIEETLAAEQRGQHDEVMSDDEDDDAFIYCNHDNDDEDE